MKIITFIFLFIALSIVSYAQEVSENGILHMGPWEKQWGYAQGRKVGNTLYISGTVAAGETMEKQITGIFENIKKTLNAYGLDASHIVKEVVYTTDIEATKSANAPRLAFYKGNTPAATWVQIEKLFSPGAKIEITVEAKFNLEE
ncbi:MAG: RidA family protein [Candidatus Cyclobacteriaceae bacterium M2_1C_046]